MSYARYYGRQSSDALGRGMEYLVLGHAGAPVLVFPTSRGRFYQWEDFSMVATLRPWLENGWLQLFCVDSVDNESWYNLEADPRHQLEWHLAYDRYLSEEFCPLIRQINPVDFLIVTGVSFGAFHAVNFAFRHPTLVKRVVAMSGDYCIRKYLDEHYDMDVYYNCPVDYLGGMGEGPQLDALRKLKVILAAGEHDFCLGPTLRLADLLSRLQIPQRVAVWGEGSPHDWPTWKQMVTRLL